MHDSKKLTTSTGAPIADNQNSITAGPRGPLLVQDYQLTEKLAHQNRERIPELSQSGCFLRAELVQGSGGKSGFRRIAAENLGRR